MTNSVQKTHTYNEALLCILHKRGTLKTRKNTFNTENNRGLGGH